ncbi:MAG: DUF255 domain-containing protein [Candidatus Eiseniibacteriota bacterium]
MSKVRRTLPALAWLVFALPHPCAADEPTVEWRPWGGAAFKEAGERGLPVFLLLTAPWNRDHFVLVERLFADERVAAALAQQAVPVRADASLHPELRSLYSISSGLLPSFHFLDAKGEVLASLPPLERDELLHFLGQMADSPPRLAPGKPEAGETWEMNPRKLANRIARNLLDGFDAGARDPGERHRDLDPSAIAFLVEYTGAYAQRREMLPELDHEIRALLAGPYHDRVDGGFHRALADPLAGVVHHEKLLRPNAELGAALASRYRMSGTEELGAAAAGTLAMLNAALTPGEPGLCSGSLGADVYGAAGEVSVHGARYYSMNEPTRRQHPRPPASADVPVGANFVAQESLLMYLRVFRSAEIAAAMRRGGEALLARGFEADGAARRALDLAGAGNLRDQADAGSGLLAYHAVTGDPRALAAAGGIARELKRHFWDGERRAFRSVSRASDLPERIRDAPPDPAWNGIALRFLVEWAAVGGEEPARDVARASLDAWAGRMPVEPRGTGELGRAALRAERPLPVLVLVADPASPEGETLRDLALRLFDPLLLVRWIDPATPGDARAFGLDPSEEPAAYLVWDGPSGPIRDGDALREVFDRVRRRLRR